MTSVALGCWPLCSSPRPATEGTEGLASSAEGLPQEQAGPETIALQSPIAPATISSALNPACWVLSYDLLISEEKQLSTTVTQKDEITDTEFSSTDLSLLVSWLTKHILSKRVYNTGGP